MNPILSAFLSLVSVWACGYFTFAFFNTNPNAPRQRFVFPLMMFVTGLAGILLQLDVMGL